MGSEMCIRDRLRRKWKKEGMKRILDLGCGTGRHLVYLAKKGFEAYGIDIAEEGIKIARKWLEKENLRADLKVGDIYKTLPYKDGFFDAVICIRTLNHGKIEWIRKAIKEMHRILKPNGYVFVAVHKHKGKKHIPKEKLYEIKWIAPRTYVMLNGPEKGIPHYRFNKKILIKELKQAGFKNLRFSNQHNPRDFTASCKILIVLLILCCLVKSTSTVFSIVDTYF